MTHQTRCIIPPGWDAGPSQATSPAITGIHLYSSSKRGNTVNCVAQGHRETECDPDKIGTRDLPTPNKLTSVVLNPFSTEPVLQIPLFHLLMGALICNYLPDEASSVHEFSTMNQQDGRFQFDPKWSNLRYYAHDQLRLEQAKLAIA
jgi:hypothetical protein